MNPSYPTEDVGGLKRDSPSWAAVAGVIVLNVSVLAGIWFYLAMVNP